MATIAKTIDKTVAKKVLFMSFQFKFQSYYYNYLSLIIIHYCITHILTYTGLFYLPQIYYNIFNKGELLMQGGLAI